MSRRYVNYWQYIYGTHDTVNGVVMRGELFTDCERRKAGVPKNLCRVVRVPSDTVYWWFGARYSWYPSALIGH